MVATPDGLFHRRPSEEVFHLVPLSSGALSSVIGSEGGAIWYISDQGIFQISSQDLRLEEILTFSTPFEPVSFLDDGQGRLWLASESHLGTYHIESGAWAPEVVDFGALSGSTIDGLNLPMLLDRRGNLWLTLSGKGLLAYDTVGQHLQHFAHRKTHPDSLASDYLLTMLEDRSGVLWFGTLDGISKLDPTRQGALLLQHDPNDASSLSAGEVLTAHRGPSGRLWVGHWGSGVDEVDPSGKVIRRLTTRSSSPVGLASGIVWALFEDPEQRLWLGTEKGLERYDPQDDTFKLFPMPNPKLAVETSSGRVVTLVADPAGAIWAGTPNGLYFLDEGREELVETPYLQEGQVPTHILALLWDSFGHLWIGTDGNGLYRLNPESLEVERFRQQSGDPSSLPHNIVSDLHEANGVLWISTLGGGLVSHRIGSNRFDSLASRHNFLSSSIASILPASDGRLWLPTDKGLNRYDPRHQVLEAWDASDGLPNRGFTSKASFVDSNGTLFLGSPQGLYTLVPERFEADVTPPKPIITSLSILNLPVSLRRLETNSPLHVSITETESLTLSYKEYLFSLEFTGLHFANPARNHYRYRLERADPDWVEASSEQRTAQYSHLSPGKYLFEVYASNRDGIESPIPARLEVIVLPPPWRTWWAYTLYSLALLAAIIAFVRAQQRKVQQQLEINQQLDELVTARTEQVQILTGLLPICSGCKKIRDDAGYWNDVESFVEERTEAVFSHSLCQPCASQLYPDIDFSNRAGSQTRPLA